VNPFCTKRWFIGFLCICIGSFGHVFMLPFADMTLFTTTCSAAILITVILSMIMLGEKLIPKYDFPAAIFISVGSVITILQMNTTVDTTMNKE
jgi:drug/metabolite transporter (DMT)-like permease